MAETLSRAPVSSCSPVSHFYLHPAARPLPHMTKRPMSLDRESTPHTPTVVAPQLGPVCLLTLLLVIDPVPCCPVFHL